MKTLVLSIATACVLALASMACDSNQTSPVQPSSIQPSSTVGSTGGPVSQPTGKPTPSFTHQCTAGGQTTATWTGAQLVRVEIRWSTSPQVSFDVKRKPSGSISVSTPASVVQSEASFYDSAGVEVAGLVDRDCSDGVPTP